MTTRKTKTNWMQRYGPWILAAALAAFVLFDPASGVNVMPAVEAVTATVGTSLTVATFLEHMLYVLVSLALVVGILRFFDSYVLGVSFSVWHNKIKTNATACSIYTGLRFLAICVLIGLILS